MTSSTLYHNQTDDNFHDIGHGQDLLTRITPTEKKNGHGNLAFIVENMELDVIQDIFVLLVTLHCVKVLVSLRIIPVKSIILIGGK